MMMMRVNIRLSPHIEMQTYTGCGLKLFRDQFPETLSLSRLRRKRVSHLAFCQRLMVFSPRLGFKRPEPFPSQEAADDASLLTWNSQVRRFRQHEVYIVYLGGHYHGKDATTDDFDRAINSHNEIMESILESKEKANQAIIHSYTKHINGFVAYLEEEEATRLSKHPDVISVFRNVNQLHTTRSWDFLGFERNGFVPPSSIWTKANYGKDVIIAHLDTGVWPESASFRDDGLGQIPAKWKGSCENSTKNGVVCNRKLIGAKYFDKGYKAGGGIPSNVSIGTTRDTDGHGTHTLSTAGGGFVPQASLFGFANGTVRGGSPAAHVASYKVCWEMGCSDADILAGFDEAINDGVDVLSVSLGGFSFDYFSDSVAVGSFHAMLSGISVACSAGNDGPSEGLVSNSAPWVTTVAASTIDRDFTNFVTLSNKRQIFGKSMTAKSLPSNKLYPLINSFDAKADNVSIHEARLCYLGSLNPQKVKGKIVICLRGDVDRLEKGLAVHNAGGVGMIHVNDKDDTMVADPHIIPATMISNESGLLLQSYMNSTKSLLGTISAGKTTIGVKPAPAMASFSSRGPNFKSPQLLKPDITAPGVDILASFTKAAPVSESTYNTRRWPFNLLSGTSMACPHVAGIIGLLRKLYPHWSPAAIRSAIMTTARTRDNTGVPMKDEDTGREATPFAYGAGHIQPNRAMDPGLVYDMGIEDHLDFICSLGMNSTQMLSLIGKPYECSMKKMVVENMNNPSFAIPSLNKTMTVTRTLKNVGSPGTYRVKIKAPKGILVSVDPQVLQFNEVGEVKEFKVSFKSTKGVLGKGYSFGMLIWSDGKHFVRSPMAVNATS